MNGAWTKGKGQQEIEVKAANWAEAETTPFKRAFVPEGEEDSYPASLLPPPVSSPSGPDSALGQEPLGEEEIDSSGSGHATGEQSGEVNEDQVNDVAGPFSPPAELPDLTPLYKEIEDDARRLQNAIESVLHIEKRQEARITKEIVEISLALAEELVAGALEVEPERLLDIAKESLSLLSDSKECIVRVHPLVHKKLEELGMWETLKEDSRVTIKPDSAVGEGPGCVIESNKGRVDARVRERLKRARYLFARDEGQLEED